MKWGMSLVLRREDTNDYRGYGFGITRKSRGMCSLARVSTAFGVKHFIAQFGLTFTSTFLG
jgi:hypothetical protein